MATRAPSIGLPEESETFITTVLGALGTRDWGDSDTDIGLRPAMLKRRRMLSPGFPRPRFKSTCTLFATALACTPIVPVAGAGWLAASVPIGNEVPESWRNASEGSRDFTALNCT